MPQIVFTVLQVLFLVLLYVFVARAVRWVIRDIASGGGQSVAPLQRRQARRPATSRRALPRELVIHFPQGPPRVLPLSETTQVTFGRHDTATVVLGDPYASDFHASIHLLEGAWVVQDEGSTNGTFLNQERIVGPRQLKAGDQLSVGRTRVEVRR